VDIDANTRERTCFSKQMRSLEHNIVLHLGANLKEEHSDLDTFATLFDSLNIEDPLQGSAPPLPITIVPKAKAEGGKIVLTSFDAHTETTVPKLILRIDNEGRLVNPNTDIVFVRANNGHTIAVGHKYGPTTKPLTEDDIKLLKQNRWIYDVDLIKSYTPKKPE
jgi:hypothetical protein